ncbi:MAG: ribokinase [Gammaproteobacteria bacterium]|nr:ribokinase [Gammaproteobacteria bacterium]MDH4253383.1 ribokinase [Gammaproteobacteria bacterium]MDH5310306.1 ribokinase [Gammaproteobacteria bacterium]
MQEILVIGSSNTDMVMSVDEIPVPGQTVIGGNFRVFGGGKGANQAIAARRAGGRVKFLFSVGNDPFGEAALRSMRREDIDITHALVLDGAPSGVALIFVDARGENCIGVAPGANARLSPGYLEQHAAIFANAAFLLLQLEIPIAAVSCAAGLARAHAVPVILNPAPAAPIPDDVLRGLFCMTPNESEAEQLSGLRVTDTRSAEQAADVLLGRGVQNVIITMGGNGALLKGAAGLHHEPAPAVEVVDTTAAGDTFNGVLAATLAEGLGLHDAMRVAVRAASLSVTRRGATDSIPRREDYRT